MFAIIRKDGKQYRVSKGETIKFDRILSEPGDAELPRCQRRPADAATPLQRSGYRPAA